MRKKNILSAFIASIYIASCSSFLDEGENKESKSNNQGGSIQYNNNQDSANEKDTQEEEDIQDENEGEVFSVTFYNENIQLDSTKTRLGEQPIYKGPIPGDKTEELGKNVITYRFLGWNEDPDASPKEAIKTSDLPVVTDDTTYFAIFSNGEESNIVNVSVTFYNDNKYICSESLKKGEVPKYKAAVPKKDSVTSIKGYIRIYKFEGWHTSNIASPKSAIQTKDLPIAYENTKYYAIFSYNDYIDGYPSVFYTITFKNYTAELSTERYFEKTKPTYYGTIPTTSTSIGYTTKKLFTFVGWNTDRDATASQAIPSDELPIVTKDTTYYAIYSSSEYPLSKYTVTFEDQDEEILFEDKEAYEGHKPKYVGEKPIKEGSKFVGWHKDPKASASQAIKEEDLPAVTKDEVYYAIFTSDFFMLDKSEVELDIGGERIYTQNDFGTNDPSISGELLPVFASTEKITCEFSAVSNYPLNELTVLWSLDEANDSNYFSIENIEKTNPGTSEVKIKAIKQSRITKLKATLVNKNDTKKVLKTAYCEIRSVTTDFYHIKEYSYSKDNIAGEIGSNLGAGYAVSLYRVFYNYDEAKSEDLVCPTKVNINGSIKPVRQLLPIKGPKFFSQIRNFYIPDTVFNIYQNVLYMVNIGSSVIFSAKPNSILLIYNSNFSCDISDRFAYQLLNKQAKLVFPYNKYAIDITSKDITHEEFKYPTWTKAQMDAYNKTSTLFKKV